MLTTTQRTPAPAVVSTTTVTRPRATVSTPPRATTTFATVAPTSRPGPTTLTTTTTTSPAPGSAEQHQARETCLALAAANHYRVVAANETWLRQQLRDLTARHLLAGPQARALRIEEAQAQTEIDAQYAIDKSNCYLG